MLPRLFRSGAVPGQVSADINDILYGIDRGLQ